MLREDLEVEMGAVEVELRAGGVGGPESVLDGEGVEAGWSAGLLTRRGRGADETRPWSQG